MDKKVSIIIPLYNALMTIRATVESCLNQSYPGIEIIVIDDGSVDGSREAIEDYISSKDVRYFYQENKGRSAARNYGLDVAEGEYINFLDSDDLLHKSKILRHVSYMGVNENCDASYSAAEYVDLSTYLPLFIQGRESSSKNITNELVLGNFIPIQAVLFKKNDVRFTESLHVMEDWEFWVNVFYKKEVHYIDEVLSSVHIGEQQLKKYRLEMRKGQVFLLRKFMQDTRFKEQRLGMLFSILKYRVSFFLIKFNPLIS